MENQESSKSTEKKKYWLKLEKNFLQSKYIKIIKNMPNGKDYILFYLALMLESIESVGHLRFTEFVSYNEDMLASLTDTNIDIVRSAVKLFKELGLIQFLSDGTIFVPEVPNMTGKECESAERVRLFRARGSQKALQCNTDVRECNDNIDIDKQVQVQVQVQKQEHKNTCDHDDHKPTPAASAKTPRFKKPSIEEVKAYCQKRGNNVDAEHFHAYYESNGWRVGKNPMKDWHGAICTWEKNSYSSSRSRDSPPEVEETDEVRALRIKLGWGVLHEYPDEGDQSNAQ